MSGNRDMDAVRRIGALALFAAVGTSIAALPRAVLPWPWLLALVGPAALFGLRRSPPRRPFVRALLATLLQLAACALAYRAFGPITRPAALAGTILPPMMFVTVRRLDVDATLGLFLSLCVLLVGTILGQTPHWVIGAYLVAAVLQLRCEARLDALRASAAPPPTRRRDPGLPRLSWLGLGLLSVLVAMALDRSLAALPSLVDETPHASDQEGRGNRGIGLPDSFNLDGGGELLDLQGERLVEVHPIDQLAVPEDLYLRSGFFEEPGLDSWSVGRLRSEVVDSGRREWRLRRPMRGAPTQRIELLRAAGARDRVFTPPGTCTIYGLESLIVDAEREWFREPLPQPQGVYEVEFQDLRLPDHDTRIAAGWADRGLVRVPPGTDHELLLRLHREWNPQGDALTKAAHIARELGRRCRYLRREPAGPYDHSLLNFLDGERTGFCMHFASAAAILLRMSDVPCRIGVGLYGGVQGTAQGSRVYGSQHAHAWVEIPFEGRGWVVFDPTPPAERGQGANVDPTTEDAPAAAGEGSDDDDDGTLSAVLDFVRAALATPWPWLGLIAALLLQTRSTPLAARRAAPLPRATRPARRWLLQILRALRERGLVRPHGATLEQLADQLRAADRLPADLQSALLAYQEIRFGGRGWNDQFERRMQQGLEAARELPGHAPVP